MSSAFLCVQFRNLLPSEQLVLLARALWTNLQRAGVHVERGDAVLSIALIPALAGADASYEVELTLPGAPRRGTARDGDPRVAVDEAFAKWDPADASADLDDAALDGESATVALSG
ncbi:MAG: hypothetical protein ABW252_15045 [Polyangiales bacterium]